MTPTKSARILGALVFWTTPLSMSRHGYEVTASTNLAGRIDWAREGAYFGKVTCSALSDRPLGLGGFRRLTLRGFFLQLPAPVPALRRARSTCVTTCRLIWSKANGQLPAPLPSARTIRFLWSMAQPAATGTLVPLAKRKIPTKASVRTTEARQATCWSNSSQRLANFWARWRASGQTPQLRSRFGVPNRVRGFLSTERSQ